MGLGSSTHAGEEFSTPKRQSSASSSTQKKPEDVVLEKVLANSIIKQKLGNNIQQMKMFAQQLAYPEELKESYLHTDWVQTTKLISDISNKVNEEAALNDGSNSQDLIRRGSQLLQSTQSANDMKIIGSFNSTMNTQQEGDVFNSEIAKQPPLQLKDKIRIKLLVTETARNNTDRTIRQLLSPVLNQFNVLPEMGMFHTALIVGPWKLEFNDSGIVVPRKIMSQAAVVTADIDYISTVDRLEQVIDSLAKVICKWNVTMYYKQTGGDKSKYGNCQDFVDDCMEALGVKLNFDGALKNFLARLRKTGNSKLQFEMTREFIETFQLVEIYPSLQRALQQHQDSSSNGSNNSAEEKEEDPAGALIFNTHKELDKFVWILMNKDFEFQNHYPCEYQLLKSFDRAFWVKAITYPDMQQFHPLYEDEEKNQPPPKNEERKHKCPFGDPCAASFIYLK